MENPASEPPQQSCEDVRKSGYLRKQKSMHRRYFVLRTASERGAARLEYYESEKKFRGKAPIPKKALVLETCFNINKRADSKNKHMIVLYTRAESFAIAAENEADQDEWYQAMVDLQCKTWPRDPRKSKGGSIARSSCLACITVELQSKESSAKSSQEPSQQHRGFPSANGASEDLFHELFNNSGVSDVGSAGSRPFISVPGQAVAGASARRRRRNRRNRRNRRVLRAPGSLRGADRAAPQRPDTHLFVYDRLSRSVGHDGKTRSLLLHGNREPRPYQLDRVRRRQRAKQLSLFRTAVLSPKRCREHDVTGITDGVPAVVHTLT
ncbi:unnamed protein product [Arctogadus glacialis]